MREKLQRIAYIQDPQVKDIIGMKESDNEGNGTFRYRNKAQFHVSTGGVITRKGGVVENLGEPTVGFFRFKSHHVVDCEECCLQSPAAMAAANALRRFMEEDNITAWDPKWEKGLIRDLVVKTGFATKEVMAIVIINGNGIPNVQKLVSTVSYTHLLMGSIFFPLSPTGIPFSKSISIYVGSSGAFSGGTLST